MNSIALKPKKAIWSVIEKQGSYIAQVTEANGRSRMEGWRVVMTGLTVSQACEWRDSMNHPSQTPNNLSDVFVYHCNPAPQEEISEFDIIRALCSDGFYRTGSVITWNKRFVLIEVGNIVYRATRNSAELIAKVDDMDYDLTDEYNAWLDEIEETYAIQTQAEMVA